MIINPNPIMFLTRELHSSNLLCLVTLLFLSQGSTEVPAESHAEKCTIANVHAKKAVPENCSKYKECSWSGVDEYAYEMRDCPHPRIFDETTKQCVPPETINMDKNLNRTVCVFVTDTSGTTPKKGNNRKRKTNTKTPSTTSPESTIELRKTQNTTPVSNAEISIAALTSALTVNTASTSTLISTAQPSTLPTTIPDSKDAPSTTSTPTPGLNVELTTTASIQTPVSNIELTTASVPSTVSNVELTTATMTSIPTPTQILKMEVSTTSTLEITSTTQPPPISAALGRSFFSSSINNPQPDPTHQIPSTSDEEVSTNRPTGLIEPTVQEVSAGPTIPKGYNGTKLPREPKGPKLPREPEGPKLPREPPTLPHESKGPTLPREPNEPTVPHGRTGFRTSGPARPLSIHSSLTKNTGPVSFQGPSRRQRPSVPAVPHMASFPVFPKRHSAIGKRKLDIFEIFSENFGHFGYKKPFNAFPETHDEQPAYGTDEN